MSFHAWRLAVLLCSPLLLAACGPSGEQRTTQRLDNRLADTLGPDIAAGNAVLQPLPDGARVTFLGSSLFPADERALDDQQRDVRAGVVEGLLDPSLMQLQIVDTTALPDDQRDARVRNVARYFDAYGLGPTLLPAPPRAVLPPGPPGATPPGLTITISLQCPHRHNGSGYGDGRWRPVCDG
jgi:hypothetical protein